MNHMGNPGAHAAAETRNSANVCNAGRSECADAYPGIVAQVGPRERIIRCRRDLQYITQRRVRYRPERAWESFCFLIYLSRRKAAPDAFQGARSGAH